MGTTRIYAVYQTTWTLWLHRNSQVYQNRPLRFAPRINVDLAKAHLKAATQYTVSQKKKRQMTHAVALIVPYSRERATITQVWSDNGLEGNEGGEVI